MELILACCACILLSAYSLATRKLSQSGAIAAFIVGLATFTNPNPIFSVILLVFFLAGSKATKYKKNIKLKLESDYEGSSQLNWVQVFANGFLGSLISLYSMYAAKEE